MDDGTDLGDDLELWQFLPQFEFCCWLALLLAPLQYYADGPSVSVDQAAVRTLVLVIAALGATVLRFVNWRRRNMQSVARRVLEAPTNTESDGSVI